MARAPVPIGAATEDNWSRGRGSTLEGKTNVDRALGKCIGSVIGGALLGALIGGAAGDTKKGALIGTAVGAGVCVILIKVASNQDKRALREAQLNAANEGRVERRSWVSSEGAELNAVVTPSKPVPLVVSSSTGSYRCRTDNMCLVGDTWVPYRTLLDSPGVGVQNASAQTRVYKCRRLDTSISADGGNANPGGEAVCLVGDSWITGEKLKKMKIRDADVVTT